MQCFGNYNKYDRICQLCSETNLFTACQCKNETELKKKINDEIIKCPYRKTRYTKDRDCYHKCDKTEKDCYCKYLEWGE